jgi:uncharacterized protein (TIGR02599 family)
MRLPRRFRSSGSRHGFTLVELLVSVAILSLIMLMVAQMIGDTSKIWKQTTGKIDAFRQARLGFELMTDELRQATTNTYWDYFNSSGQTVAEYNAGGGATFLPAAYGRQSELHFISGLSTGLGLTLPGGCSTLTHGVFFSWPGGYTQNADYSSLNSLLTATGFFVEFGPDTVVANGPPVAVLTNYQPNYRCRLMQFIQPTESLAVYNYSLTTGTNPNDWFVTPINTSHATTVRIVADNVIALIIWPKQTDTVDDTDKNNPNESTALAADYAFDSRLGLKSGDPTTGGTTPWTPGTGNQPLQMNQMPPILSIAMVSLDETSAKILQGTSTNVPTQITEALNGLFTTASPAASTTVSNMDADLVTLEARLAAVTPRLNFQVFNTTIAIRNAKFSNP